ncbi:MAG: RNA methyltransferase [Thermomicrobiales bacterium]
MSDAVNRRTLATETTEKTSRWPRTERRQERVRSVLEKRQPDLTLILENVHDPHNVSAILRTCDAVGVGKVHAVYTIERPPPGLFMRQTSASAVKWVEVEHHESMAACVAPLRAGGARILATALEQESRPLYDWDLTGNVALIMGNEMRGVSEEALALADGLIEIPMAGMVQSLNVSVASAVCLYEAFRQRLAAGDYASPRYSEGELAALEADWLRR